MDKYITTRAMFYTLYYFNIYTIYLEYEKISLQAKKAGKYNARI